MLVIHARGCRSISLLPHGGRRMPRGVSGRQGSRMCAIAIRFTKPTGVSGSADHRARHGSRAPLSCGHDNERKSERTSSLTTPLGEIKTGRAGPSVVFTSGAAKTQPDQILVSSEPSVALASGVVPL